MRLEGLPQSVSLRDGTVVLLRPMVPEDGPRLLEFFRALPEQDRLFLRDDVTKAEVIDRFTREGNYDRVLPVLAEHTGEIVGDATLHRARHGWSMHVAEIRVVVARAFQRKGLGTALARCLVRQAMSLGVDKLVAQVIQNQVGAKRAFEKLGFQSEAVLRNYVRDIRGNKQDLVIMTNDVSAIWATMEALVADFAPSRGMGG